MSCCRTKRRMIYAFTTVLALNVGITLASMVQEDSKPKSNSTEEQRTDDPARSDPILDPSVRLQSFEKVWTTVRDKHWDPSLHGLDWNAVREEFLPRATEAATTEQLDEVLNEMLGRLGQSHFGVIPADVYRSIEDSNSENSAGQEDASNDSPPVGTIGASLRIVDGQATVWRMDPEGSAAVAGIRTGWILQSIDGEDLPSRLQRISESVSSATDPELLKRLIVDHLTDGPHGKTKSFVWQDADGKSHESILEFKTPAGMRSQFGNLPATHVTCETKVLYSGVMVFSLGQFFEPTVVLTKFEELLRENEGASGLIIDLRGNPGGLGFMAMSIGGFLAKEKGLYLGSMTTRAGSLKFSLVPRSISFHGKVAVLVDEYSMSTSEILAAGLQETGLARIFGRKTPGMALPSAIEMLPHGSGFQYAFANYEMASGEPLEGRGVVPDESVSLQREDLLAARDADLEAAVRWIHEK